MFMNDRKTPGAHWARVFAPEYLIGYTVVSFYVSVSDDYTYSPYGQIS